MEELVAELDNLPTGDSERRKLLQLIRNKGNFEHNKGVLSEGGSLIVCQRPTTTREITNDINLYVACSRCYGFYHKKEIYRHLCPATETFHDVGKLLPSHLLAKTAEDVDLASFFNRMHNDHLTRVASSDSTIKDFIVQQLDETGVKSFNTIANKVRLLAEFVVECRKLNRKEETLSGLLNAENISYVKEAVKKMFNYNVESKGKDLKVTLDRPSSLIRLKQTLDKIATLLHVTAIKTCQWDICKKLEYLPLILSHYLDPLRVNARKNMRCSSSGLPQALPESHVIAVLVNFLDNQLSCLDQNPENRRVISEFVLSRILIFNKRRSGEVAKISLEQWESRNKWKNDVMKDAESLDPTERIVVKNFDLLYVNGKGNRFVPVIIPPVVTEMMNYLAKTTHNRYIFCNILDGHLRGHDALRNSVKAAGIESTIITSTKFRKLSATALQLKNLSESEFRILCEHYGHTLPVHKRWYRLRDSTTELVKVSQMLLASDNRAGEILMEDSDEEKTEEIDKDKLEQKKQENIRQQKSKLQQKESKVISKVKPNASESTESQSSVEKKSSIKLRDGQVL